MVYPSRGDLQRLWKKLMSIALYRGLLYADAEDVVSDTFRSGLESYEQSKGEFEMYCSSILHNRIINYWRDRKKIEVFEEERHHAGLCTPQDLLETEERMQAMEKMVGILVGSLNEKEKKFLAEYVEVLDRLGKRAVSEAARNASISVAEGHNVFRKIRRKAKTMYPLSSDERMLLAGEPDVCYEIGLSERMNEGFRKFEEMLLKNRFGYSSAK
jgi:DNA-directed RNA polymerase specialized sigma24 family protein